MNPRMPPSWLEDFAPFTLLHILSVAVCAALRNPLPPQVILMTGLSDNEHVRRALDLGVVALLRKPLTRETVIDAIGIAAERCQRDPLSKLRWHFGMHPRA